MEIIYVGTKVRTSCAFVGMDSVSPVDPTEVTCEVVAPNAVAMLYTWPSDPDIIRDSAGKFHLDIHANLPGVWRYRWASTGAVEAASRGQFKVSP